MQQLVSKFDFPSGLHKVSSEASSLAVAVISSNQVSNKLPFPLTE